MTTASISSRVIHNKGKLLSLPNINWKFIYVFGLTMCFLMFVFYILNINQLTKGAYLIVEYNQKISSLTKENRAMESNFAEKGLLDRMHNRANELGFEKISNVKYLEILNVSLARAR